MIDTKETLRERGKTESKEIPKSQLPFFKNTHTMRAL
jgi:hypothetical protein